MAKREIRYCCGSKNTWWILPAIVLNWKGKTIVAKLEEQRSEFRLRKSFVLVLTITTLLVHFKHHSPPLLTTPFVPFTHFSIKSSVIQCLQFPSLGFRSLHPSVSIPFPAQVCSFISGSRPPTECALTSFSIVLQLVSRSVQSQSNPHKVGG